MDERKEHLTPYDRVFWGDPRPDSTAGYHSEGDPPSDPGPWRPPLRRMRLPLDNHASDLMLVGDRFEEGGRYVQREVPRADSEAWSWLDWDERYDRLADEWHARYGAKGNRPEPQEVTINVRTTGKWDPGAT